MNENTEADFCNEIRRIHRVSDMLCSAHATLRDRFSRRALLLDLAILALSTWLVAVVFIEPRIGKSLSPRGIEPEIWIGVLSVFTFFLSILQIKVDWKGRSDRHAQALAMYADVKRESGYVLTASTYLKLEDCRHILARYEMAGSLGVEIPEAVFLALKSKHLLKVAVSKHLSDHPSASVLLLRIRWWIRDNWENHAPHSQK